MKRMVYLCSFACIFLLAGCGNMFKKEEATEQTEMQNVRDEHRESGEQLREAAEVTEAENVK